MYRLPDRKRAHEIAALACTLHYETCELYDTINALYDRLDVLEGQNEALIGQLVRNETVTEIAMRSAYQLAQERE